MQSGRAKLKNWVIQPDLETPRTPDALMGWAGADDTLAEIWGRLTFKTKEEAVAFAEAKGWTVTVQDAHDRTVTPRNYLDNFKRVG
jgi:hypothetical protein